MKKPFSSVERFLIGWGFLMDGKRIESVLFVALSMIILSSVLFTLADKYKGINKKTSTLVGTWFLKLAPLVIGLSFLVWFLSKV